jgi:hypothetical protein
MMKVSEMSTARRLIAGTLVVASGALVVAGCGGDGSSNAETTTTTKASASDVPGTAKVTSFEVPATASCNGATSTTVSVTYATEGAKKQELYVDGALTPGTEAATGSIVAPVHCDPLPHTFVLVAYDANGRRTTSEKKLTTS